MKTMEMKTIYSQDLAQKKILAVREFAAPVEKVWKAWTDPALLEQWWAPLPYKAITKTMDFREGGYWLYYMLGPDGSKQYCRADYKVIVTMKSYEGFDGFCDEQGVVNVELPGMYWRVQFSPSPAGTKVEVETSFSSEADLLKTIEMGFEEGFAAAHNNLDLLLAK